MSLKSFIDKFGGWTEEYKFYNGEITLRYDPKAHVYLLVSGTELIPQDGVTTVCHIIDKSDALIPWGCKMMAQKLLATVPTIELPSGDKAVQIMLPEFEALVLAAKNAHKEKLEEAATVGSLAHAWIEAYIKRLLSAAPGEAVMPQFPENERSTNCCRAALDWMEQHKVRWLCTERKIYSRRHGYAGTLDGTAYVSSCDNPLCCPHEFYDRLSVIDWKSSNYLYLEYLYQTAAYQYAYMEETLEGVEDRWIIRLGKDDGEFETWHAEGNDFAHDMDGFLTCLSLVRDVRRTKEQIKARAAAIKLEKKLQAQAEKEAALKIKCKNADKYKGVRKPSCNGGSPCQACLEKYEQIQRDKDQDAIVRINVKQ